MPTNIPRKLPAGIWALGFVSMLMDVSSELVHSLLPLFLTTILGASMVTIGLIEGIAEATAAILKVFSGTISDAIGRRKPLLIIGYGLAALSKPLFPMATSIIWVFTARFTDRIGKGIRVAPRDALVADIVPPSLRGTAYGLRQALDSVGAFIGPLLAILLMLWLANDIRVVLWLAVIPAVIAVLVLIVAVPSSPSHLTESAARTSLNLKDARQLSTRFWLVVMLGSVFTLARFSEAFLILRAQSLDLELAFIPLVMVVMNVAYAAIAYPAGKLSDRIGTRSLLLWGMLILVVADVLLALTKDLWMLFAGVALWGIHMGLTQGLLNKLVADAAPQYMRGTAFGVFNLICGIAVLLASVIAGILWDQFGASMTFITGAVFALVAAIGILFYSHFSARTN